LVTGELDDALHDLAEEICSQGDPRSVLQRLGEMSAYGGHMPTRAAVWLKDEPVGCEFAEITLGPDRLTARGVAIGISPIPYRLDYVLETGAAFVTTLLDASSRGAEWSRRLVLRGDGAGSWTINAEAEGNADLPAPGGDPATLAGVLDCDLGLSPVTNVMPILRYGLLSGSGQVDLTTAWVSVPDLRVRPDGQRYTGAGTNLVRYDALDGSFSATITLDDDGLVVDYPGIASRAQGGG
jgi:hypothetical protein